MQLSITGTKLYCFELSIGCNAKFSTFEWLLWQPALLEGKFK